MASGSGHTTQGYNEETPLMSSVNKFRNTPWYMGFITAGVGFSSCPSPNTWPFSWMKTVSISISLIPFVAQPKFVFITISASSVDVPTQVAPKTFGSLNGSHATSLNPSNVWIGRPGMGEHRGSSDGHLVVEPPYWKLNFEYGTLFQVEWEFNRAVSPPPLEGSSAGL